MTSEWIAATYSPDALGKAFDGTVHGDGINKILGAGGEISTPGEWTCQKMQGWRNHHLIATGQKYENGLHLFFLARHQ